MVIEDVPENTVVAGCPARVIKMKDEGPIMMTALLPISTCSRMMAPGSMRALTPFRSSIGMALLRLQEILFGGEKA